MQTSVENKGGRRSVGADIARNEQNKLEHSGSSDALAGPSLHSTRRSERKERRFTNITTHSVTTTAIGLKGGAEVARQGRRVPRPQSPPQPQSQQEPDNPRADWKVLDRREDEPGAAGSGSVDPEMQGDEIALFLAVRNGTTGHGKASEKLDSGDDVEQGGPLATPADGEPGTRSASQSDRRARRAFKRFRTAADQGDAQAQLELAQCYAKGLGVKRQDDKAARWFARAAEQGQPVAQFHWGRLLANGSGVQRDDAQALAWLARAAEADDAPALYWLGLFHEQGRGGLKTCMARAYDYYRAAAQLGHGEAAYRQACCLWHGSGAERDLAAAVALYMQAAESGIADALWKLGVCYERGWCVKQKDEATAFKTFELAARQGNAHGQFHLARCYFHGIGVKQDLEAARDWWLRSEQYAGCSMQGRQFVVAGVSVSRGLKDAMAAYDEAIAEEAPRVAQCLEMVRGTSPDSDDSTDQAGSPDSAEGRDLLGSIQTTMPAPGEEGVPATGTEQTCEVADDESTCLPPGSLVPVIGPWERQRLFRLREISEPSSTPSTDSGNSDEGEADEEQPLEWQGDPTKPYATYG